MGTVFPEARDAAMSLVSTSDNVALKNGRGGKFIITLAGVDSWLYLFDSCLGPAFPVALVASAGHLVRMQVWNSDLFKSILTKQSSQEYSEFFHVCLLSSFTSSCNS